MPTVSPSERVRVELGERSYDIVIGNGLLAAAGEYLAKTLPHRPKLAIVSDDHVATLYSARLRSSLLASGWASDRLHKITIPAGEAGKDFAIVQYLVNQLLTTGVERSGALIALGGGAVGDVAGFVAAITLRGISLIQLPTTLLAQVDSSIGGKTGINTQAGKNLVGAFHQPALVLIDPELLRTLPHRQIRSGYAEVVKYALISDREFFDWLDDNGLAICSGQPDPTAYAIKRCCEIKSEFVSTDEYDYGRRSLLNFGHTFGHAIETASGFDGSTLHGEAVAAGMVLASELSQRLGWLALEQAKRVSAHLSKMGLPVSRPENCSPLQLLELMTRDKKARAGQPIFILLKKLGQAVVHDKVPSSLVVQILEEL